MALTKDERSVFDGLFPIDGTEYFDAPEPLVDGLITRHEYTLLTGQPKVGKSTFAAHLAYSVATGEPFFGREVRGPGTVLYIALERAYQTQARLHRLFTLGERQPQNIFLMKPQESQMKSLFFNEGDDVRRLIERIQRAKIGNLRLVVVDSLENTLIGSDSESKDAGPWCDGLQAFLEHFETTGLVLHHENKASSDDTRSNTAYRGSSVFLARSGMWLRALNSGGGVLLKAQQGNFGADWEQRVSFNDFGLYTDSMPTLGKEKKPNFNEFVKARLIENPMITTKGLTEVIRNHPESQWRDIGEDRVSKEVTKMGAQIVKHANPNDGRSKLLEWVD